MWKPLRDENRLSILKIYGYTCDRLVREEERQNIDPTHVIWTQA